MFILVKTRTRFPQSYPRSFFYCRQFTSRFREKDMLEGRYWSVFTRWAGHQWQTKLVLTWRPPFLQTQPSTSCRFQNLLLQMGSHIWSHHDASDETSKHIQAYFLGRLAEAQGQPPGYQEEALLCLRPNLTMALLNLSQVRSHKCVIITGGNENFGSLSENHTCINVNIIVLGLRLFWTWSARSAGCLHLQSQ